MHPTINPDILDKSELIEHLVRLTGKSGAFFEADSVRTLRVMLVTAIEANPDGGVARNPTAVGGGATLTPEDIERLIEQAATRAEQRVVQRIRQASISTTEGAAPASDGEPAISVSFGADSQGIHVPAILAEYRNPFKAFCSRIEAESRDTGVPIHIGLVGPTGSGKTTFAVQFAAQTNRPCYILNVGAVSEAEQLLYTWEAKDGTTYQTPSELSRAIQVENAVIVLDELTRGANAKVTNGILDMLDHRAVLGNVPVAPGVVFFATLNEGVGYTGTDLIDEALENRLAYFLHIPYSTEEEEILIEKYGCDPVLAKHLVLLARNLRGEYDRISLRTLGAAVRQVKYGASIGEALFCTFARIVPPDVLVSAAASTIPNITFPNY
jgi:nitric oxide reductase NorQ protein